MPAEKRKLLILSVLETLRTQTDSMHRLRQAPLIDMLAERYGVRPTRKTLRQNISDLIDAGYPIRFDQGWYYAHEFAKPELDLVIDSLRCSAAIPAEEREVLIARLASLRGSWYRPEPDPAHPAPENRQFMPTMDRLHNAIRAERQVSFAYADWGIDKALHPRLTPGGSIKRYRVNPYRVVTANGRYYLICNVDKYDTFCHFRIDRVLDCRTLARRAKPLSLVKGAEDGFDLPDYLRTHPYMYTGSVSRHRLLVKRALINDVLDWFGMDVLLEPGDREDEAVAEIRSDENSLRFWLARYGDGAELLR